MSKTVPVIASVDGWLKIDLKPGALLQPLDGAIYWTATDPGSGVAYATHIGSETINAISDETIWIRAIGLCDVNIALTQ